jgi:hypothetical protein
MEKIIHIDEINKAMLDGRNDAAIIDLCKFIDIESCFEPVCTPPKSFLEECEQYWAGCRSFCRTVERKIGNTWYTVETVCDGNEPLTQKVKRLIFSDREVAC